MRARIRKHELEKGWWVVETKYWWSGWVIKRYFFCDKAQERALDAAKEFVNPTIIEILK